MIRSIFISHHFDDKGNKLAEFVKALVISHNIQPITGRRLEGQPLSNGVKNKICDCQATIVLLTNREEGRNNQWVRDERAYADGKNHEIITLLDEGLFEDGMYSDNERLRIDWHQLHLCILDLSETIRSWKIKKGNNLKLLIQPDSVSDQIMNNYDNIIVRYKIRACDSFSQVSWTIIQARPEIGGATISIPGVKDNDLIEIEVNVNNEIWASPAINPNVMVKLKKR